MYVGLNKLNARVCPRILAQKTHAVSPHHLGREIHLISDSQAALLGVVKGDPRTKTIRQIQQTLEPLRNLGGETNTLVFHFAYGHVNEQDDLADKNAKLAVKEGIRAIEQDRVPSCSTIAHIPPSYVDKTRTITNELWENWGREWRNIEGRRSSERLRSLGIPTSSRHMFHGIADPNHNAIVTTWNRVVLDVGNLNRFLKSRRISRSKRCRQSGCAGSEDADHILFNCQDIEHASHQQILKNNIKNDFRIPSGLCLLSLKDVLSAMSEAETRTTENLFRLAKLIHNFITHHHDNGVI